MIKNDLKAVLTTLACAESSSKQCQAHTIIKLIENNETQIFAI